MILLGDPTQKSNNGSTGGNAGGSGAATLFSARASGTVVNGWMYTITTGDHFYLALYTSGGALISQSDQIASTVSGWNSCTWTTSPPVIAYGTSYRLFILDDNLVTYNQGLATNTAGGTSSQYMNAGITYPTAPATWSQGGQINTTQAIAAYVDDGGPSNQVFLLQA